MPQLFTSPRFIALSSTNQLLPGAKLYFRQTGTSTPQNTYQDEALTVPHANPVVADGAGVFAPIYLDPSLPNYRVILADSSGVTQPGYPIDNVPSNQNTGQTFRLKSAAPELIFEETGASDGNQKWRIRVSNEQMRIALLNDAESIATDLAIIDRSGSTVDLINLLATQVQSNDLEVLGSLAVKKSTSTDIANSNTLTDDPHLFLSVPVGGIYRIDVFLTVASPSGGSGGFRYRLVPVNGTSGTYGGFGTQNINGSAAISDFVGSFPASDFASSMGIASVIQHSTYARLTPTGAMTIKLQWSQESPDADETRMSSDSILSMTRISS